MVGIKRHCLSVWVWRQEPEPATQCHRGHSNMKKDGILRAFFALVSTRFHGARENAYESDECQDPAGNASRLGNAQPSWVSPTLLMSQDPISAPVGHQSLPQHCCSRDSLQLLHSPALPVTHIPDWPQMSVSPGRSLMPGPIFYLTSTSLKISVFFQWWFKRYVVLFCMPISPLYAKSCQIITVIKLKL